MQQMRKGCHKMILTYNSTYFDGTRTYGGYSDIIVVKEHFVICWPDNLPLDVGSPLRNFGLDKPGMYISVVGLGVLGHVAMKLAKAFGAKVTVISTSPAKKKEAIEHLGPDSFLVSSDQAQLQGIIDMVLSLLKHDGKLTLLGSPKALELPVMPMLADGQTQWVLAELELLVSWPLQPWNFSYVGRRHEITGELTEVGSKVQKVKVGDKVGVRELLLGRQIRDSSRAMKDG
ncbi:unnamed protein product [Ilex paraguariensis]|uniref:Alcohol dehydrogenase-like C-terminal domain-containing protein n=1 Tax=Ilex paraguariensis TaxID=185542 RepID=A0ABC8UXR8_9AQUA